MKIRWETSPEPMAPEYYSTATTAVGGCCGELVEGETKPPPLFWRSESAPTELRAAPEQSQGGQNASCWIVSSNFSKPPSRLDYL